MVVIKFDPMLSFFSRAVFLHIPYITPQIAEPYSVLRLILTVVVRQFTKNRSRPLLHSSSYRNGMIHHPFVMNFGCFEFALTIPEGPESPKYPVNFHRTEDCL